jgi:hypothetical protein
VAVLATTPQPYRFLAPTGRAVVRRQVR